MEPSFSIARSLALLVFQCGDRTPLASSRWKLGNPIPAKPPAHSPTLLILMILTAHKSTRLCINEFIVLLLGLVECLRQEIAHFNIRTLILEPGECRTPIMSSTRLSLGSSTNSDYAEFYEGKMTVLALIDGKQPGHPKQGAEMIVDVVKGDGRAKGKEWPVRLPMGRNALELIREKCNETLKICVDY